ncbi:MAG: hypothetical protein MAG471_00847 [Acidimicrobiaceae bacterium]|nr:hypothetical protein [Acidimicrobiaceae bacterium]
MLCGGEGGQDAVVKVGHSVWPRHECSVGGVAGRVGKQRVVAAPGGRGSLGQPHHDDGVEVEAGDHAEPAYQHAVAEAALAVEIVVEAVDDGPAEGRCSGAWLDGCQAGEAGEEVLHPGVGLDLVVRPFGAVGGRTQVAVEHSGGPAGKAGPVGGCRVGAHVGDQFLDEVEEVHGLADLVVDSGDAAGFGSL